MISSTETRLVKVQAMAGALFFIFLVMHLSNTLLAVFGSEVYNGYQRIVRQFYQNPFVEIAIVLGPLVTHAIAGIWLHRIRRKRQRSRSLKYQLHTWAGFFLLLVVFGHVLATRGISYWFGPFAEFEGVSFSIWWIPAYFYPYYFFLFMAGLYHSTLGVSMLMKRAGHVQRSNSKWLQISISTLGAIGVSFALLGFGGHLFEIKDPRDNDYARQYSKLMDIDLIPTKKNNTDN